MTSTRLIRLGIVFFWGAYFTLVFASNATDALRTMGMLPQSFAFVSGNYALMQRVTGIYGLPEFSIVALFAAVLLWQAVAAVLFWGVFTRLLRSEDTPPGTNAAFAAGLGLWAAFILADELFVAYEIAGLESTHVALLSAQLLSLLAFHAKLARRQARRGPVQER